MEAKENENEYAYIESFLYGILFKKLVEKEMELIKKEYNLSRIDIHILLYLGKHQHENDTSKDIFKLTMFTKGHISQSLTRLRNMGYVYMKQDDHDRRRTHNYLTKEAEALILMLKEKQLKIWEIAMDNISEEEKRTLKSVISKINNNINAFLSSQNA